MTGSQLSVATMETDPAYASHQRGAADEAVGLSGIEPPMSSSKERSSRRRKSRSHRTAEEGERPRSRTHRSRRSHGDEASTSRPRSQHRRSRRSSEEEQAQRRAERKERKERKERRERRRESGSRYAESQTGSEWSDDVGSVVSSQAHSESSRRHRRRNSRSVASGLSEERSEAGDSTRRRHRRRSGSSQGSDSGRSRRRSLRRSRTRDSTRHAHARSGRAGLDALEEEHASILERDLQDQDPYASPVPGSTTASTDAARSRRLLGLGGLAKLPSLRRSSQKGLGISVKDDSASEARMAEQRAKADAKTEAALRKLDEAEQKRLAVLQKKKERAEQKEEEARRKALVTQRKKELAYTAKQEKLGEKERRRQEKEEAKKAAEAAKQARASEALIEVQRRERERELAEMDRKQRRLMSITPFRRRHPKLELSMMTPMQRHMLVKVLVMLQVQEEWMGLGQHGMMGLYGFPFSTERQPVSERRAKLLLFKKEHKPVPASLAPPDEPLILRHMFQVHLRQLPGLRDAPLEYWRKRVQRINEVYCDDAMSTSREQTQLVLSHMLSLVGTQYLGLFFARGVGVRGTDELRGPGIGDPGTEEWGVGKGWGAGTVKRGLARPYVLTDRDYDLIDSLFEDTERDVWQAAGRESERVQGDFNAFKEKIIEQETGLEEITSYLTVSQVANLPIELQNAEEWVRIHVALVCRWLLVESPAADALFNFVRIAHSLFPYWAVRQALMVANAQTMIQVVLSILLVQPMGADSLFQRIIGYAIGREATTMQKEVIEPLRREVAESMLINKVDAYVRQRTASGVAHLEAESIKTGNDLLTTILLTPTEPLLDSGLKSHVLSMQAAYAASPYRTQPDLAYPASTPQGKNAKPIPSWGAPPGDVNKAREFALLKLYLRSLLEKHDRQRLAKLLSSSLFVNFIKDSLQHVFYDAVRQVSKSADLSGRLADLQKLLDDAIDVRKNSDNSLEAWIALATKHHEFIYFFVHEMAPILDPIWQWCQYGLDYMSLSTTDPQRPDDRRAQDIEVNLDEMLQDERLSDKDVDRILQEMDQLIEYSRWSKIRRELQFRRLFLLSHTPSSSGLWHESIPSDEMRKELRDVDGLLAELLRKEGKAMDDGACDDIRGGERKDVPWAFFDAADPLGQAIRAEPASKQHRLLRVRPGLRPPTLEATRKLQPLFRELLVAELPDWLDQDLNGEPRVAPKSLAQASSKLLRKTRRGEAA
ncbi:phosphatidylinositol binding protein [Malassezia pachydermatis]